MRTLRVLSLERLSLYWYRIIQQYIFSLKNVGLCFFMMSVFMALLQCRDVTAALRPYWLLSFTSTHILWHGSNCTTSFLSFSVQPRCWSKQSHRPCQENLKLFNRCYWWNFYLSILLVDRLFYCHFELLFWIFCLSPIANTLLIINTPKWCTVACLPTFP